MAKPTAQLLWDEVGHRALDGIQIFLLRLEQIYMPRGIIEP